MKKLLLLLFLSIATNLMAQKDTLYFKLDTIFHTNWLSSSKKDAEFYRPMPLKKVGDLYQIKDYYIGGNLQMEGYITNPKNAYTYQGKSTWYYKNGNIKTEEQYQDAELDGLAKTYFEDGTLKTSGTYKEDKAFDGTFDECCPYATVEEMENGKRVASYRYYKGSKVVAEKSINDKDEHTNKILAYNKKGEQIAEVTVEPIEQYIDGKNVWFNIDKDKNILNIEGFENYKNGKLHGEVINYDSNEKIISKGIYQNNQPYSGTFYYSDILKTYVNGISEGKEIAYSEDKIIAQGINKDGYHWQGQFKLGNYQIVTYKNGQLNGNQTTYYTDSFQYYFKGVKSYHHIINNKKEGESAYFDKKGKQIAKGIYKNDVPFTGTFYDDYYNALSSFKEEKKHGFFIQYDRKWKILRQQEYDEGQITGLVKSEGYVANKICECEYKKGKPFEGEVCESYSILYYKHGKIFKKNTYNSDDLETLEKVTAYNDEGEKAQTTVYNKEKTYQLTYKKGKPFNGQEFSSYNNNLITYKDGIKNGPFTEYTYEAVSIKGNYKDNLWDGPLTFDDRLYNKVTSCIYKGGKPVDGTVISNNCITNYKNGLKTGLESCSKNLYFKNNKEYKLVYDSIIQNYKNGKLHGKVQYFKEQKLVADGMYSFDSPKEGTFYINKLFENYYENGKLTKSTYYFGPYKKVDVFENWLITKEITYKDNSIVFEGNFKNGVEYNGTFLTIDNKEEPRSFTRTHYKNGKKHGKEQIINFIENTIEETNNYKEGIILQKIKKFPFKNKDSIIGVYKNSKPFSGYFYSEDNTIEKIEHYKKSVKTGYQYYYSTTGFVLKTPLDSINYVKGKPLDGIDLEVINKDYHKHFYKKGKRIQTDIFDIYYQDISDPPALRVTYTNTGFITSKFNSNTLEKHNQLIFSKADRTEGSVVFYRNKEEIGELTFANGKIEAINLSFVDNGIDAKVYKKEPNTIAIEIQNKEEFIVFHPEINFPKSIDYSYFANFPKFLWKNDGVVFYYLDNVIKPYSSCTIKNGKPYHGIVIRGYEKDNFHYKEYREGEEYKEIENLTKKELLKLLNKNGNKKNK